MALWATWTSKIPQLEPCMSNRLNKGWPSWKLRANYTDFPHQSRKTECYTPRIVLTRLNTTCVFNSNIIVGSRYMLCTSFCSTYCLAQFFLLFLFNLKVLPLLFHEKGLVLTTVILLFKDARREKMNKKSYLPTCTTHGAHCTASREGVRNFRLV